MSLTTLGLAVAVKQDTGIGEDCPFFFCSWRMKSAICMYSMRKSCPQAEKQWASSMTMRAIVLPSRTFSIVLDLKDSGAIYKSDASPETILSSVFFRSIGDSRPLI